MGDFDFGMTAVFYGRPGSGKTVLACTFPKPALLVDIGEKGTDSVRDVPDLDALMATHWEDIEAVYWLVKESGKYKTVVLDGGSALTNLAAGQARKESGKKEEDHLSKRDFGTMSRLLTTWISNFRDLQDEGINVVFVMHEKTVDLGEVDIEDEELMPEVTPRMMPSVTSHLCGAVKCVGHCFIRAGEEAGETLGDEPIRKVDYCLRLAPHPVYSAKVRSPKNSAVPAFLTNPSYDKLMAVIRGQPQGKPTTRKKVAKKAARKKVRKPTRT